MNTYPTYEEAEKIAGSGQYSVMPVATELFADQITPIEALRVLKAVSDHVYMLESAEDNQRWGRYTFLGFDPKMEITLLDHELRIRRGDEETITKVGHPGEKLRELLKDYHSPRIQSLPPFTGGLVGYFSYDFIKYSEPTLKTGAGEDEHFKDMDLMLFDRVICFDNYRQKILLIANMDLKGGREKLADAYNTAVGLLEKMKMLLLSGKKAEESPLKLKSDFKPLFSEKEYCQMVEKGKGYIKEGDIFQVVLSNRLEADMEGSLLDTYRLLRTTNPSPYMFYFSSRDVEIAGASPETLVKLEKGKLFTYPLAGTRPRGRDGAEDERLEKELLADEKERAEHNMLVDLGRNDIGKISEIGSVRVERYMDILRFSHVMHIGSTVSGQISPECDALSAVDAILPAGTLSGAPKLRACEIIEEQEECKRGIYGGAIGYIDFTGNLDTCIAIRLAFAKNGRVYVRSGAGIVADSVPRKEYRECIHKAGAVLDALKQADGGI